MKIWTNVKVSTNQGNTWGQQAAINYLGWYVMQSIDFLCLICFSEKCTSDRDLSLQTEDGAFVYTWALRGRRRQEMKTMRLQVEPWSFRLPRKEDKKKHTRCSWVIMMRNMNQAYVPWLLVFLLSKCFYSLGSLTAKSPFIRWNMTKLGRIIGSECYKKWAIKFK